MERSIILSTNDTSKDVDVSFININGKKGLIPLLLNIIINAADFINEPTGKFTAELIDVINDQLPVSKKPEYVPVSDYEREKGKSRIIFKFDETKDMKEGEPYRVDISTENSCPNDEINILAVFIRFLIKQRNIPVDIVLSTISEELERSVPEINLCDDGEEENACDGCPVFCEYSPTADENEDTDNTAEEACEKATCADCENRCEKSTEVKASEDIPCTPYGAEAKDCGECQPEYKGELRTPTNLRSTGDNGDDITLMSADKP